MLSSSFSTAALATKTDNAIHYPPDALQQWYKPANKRQVWLHSMFRLRRSLQAIEDYAEKQDSAGMQKWAQQLEKDYKSLTEMVPEWSERIDNQLVSELLQTTNTGDIKHSQTLIRKLRKNCLSCHHDYRPLVAAVYRSPDYENIKVPGDNNTTVAFHDAMEALSTSINRILIAMDDDAKTTAMQASSSLNQQLNHLATSCRQCHDDAYPVDRILGEATQQTLKQIDTAIKSDQVKDTKKLLGDIGVTVCSRCHNIHRSLYDLKNLLQK
ncbi:MAG TPA: hypothetical protein VIQ03_16595 [Gammaproteobacteria bacterium]